MKSWPGPRVPRLPGRGRPLRLYDSATGEVRPTAPGTTARMYVCGITPYDATHLGHAATYLAFDLVQRVLPPDHYVGAVEAIPEIVPMIRRLLDQGAAYHVEDDVYFSVGAAPRFGYESRLDVATMRALSAERGGDPDRPGKKDQLDPVLWRAARPGEPSWDSELGPGRPGWHVE